MSQPSPWQTANPVAAIGRPGGDVTLVEGQTFFIGDRCGDAHPSLPHGLFFLDTRMLSRFELRLNGHPLESVAVDVPEPFAATFVTRAAPAAGIADATLVAFRERHVGRGLRDRVVVTNHGLGDAPVTLELFVGADFADLFEVKESRVRAKPGVEQRVDRDSTVFRWGDGPVARQTTVAYSVPSAIEPGQATWTRVLRPRESWELCVEVTVGVGGAPIETRFPCAADDQGSSVPDERLASWRAGLPLVESDHPDLAPAVLTAGDDLGALRIFDPEHPDTPIVAAGAPWFMTVFGRDSLLAGWMTLIADRSLAHGVLETLARFQGDDVDPRTEEEPGKILHEIRFAASAALALGGGDVYYGSIDATPLFVMLTGELVRWGLPIGEVADLLPSVDAAMRWIDAFGDRDGDGYVEYERRSPHGLANQGWKDSWDGIRFADGTLAEPPIALCEVQGYVFAAHVARADLADLMDEPEVAIRHRTAAEELRRRFNDDFWLEEQGTFALGLDRDKRAIDAITSNPGHCLWTGIVEPERAPRLADRLLEDDLFCGWGLRTLATGMAAYNPVSYHNGSVWPHDNALCAAGLARYGLADQAHRIIEGQLAAASRYASRLPELFAGFPRDDLGVPGTYPASCSPQAWAAASPLLWLRTLLQLEPDVPRGQVSVTPALPSSMTRLSVTNVRVGDAVLDVEIDDDTTAVLCPGLTVLR
ncbi:MAG TPA: glycogen debranching N-terminal domain-containing protein [Acidimicrobiales bacterium]|nr:glycogen debranching N-terminal domain-containing protein [Acidimicrobiales bacterium]